MDTPRFDPTHTVKFDLSRGQVSIAGSTERVLVPADAVLALLASAGENGVADFGQRVGTEVGLRVSERLGAAMGVASVEVVLEHLGGEFALMGLGSLGVERWGNLLVLTVDNSPFGRAGDSLLAAVLEGALRRGFGREVRLVRLERYEQRVRLLALGRASAERARTLLDQGMSWTDMVHRLEQRARGEA